MCHTLMLGDIYILGFVFIIYNYNKILNFLSARNPQILLSLKSTSRAENITLQGVPNNNLFTEIPWATPLYNIYYYYYYDTPVWP